ncbi:MAG TPA: hypothetical protein VHQ65_02920 [Thermoanaerobaculia bacterium]|nr:hypothetical protein [Thermoanaerobaculia bacterium]
MARPRLLLVTYLRLVPTGQIGIFKRCLRLASRLTDEFEIHQVNFGPLPESDPLFASTAPEITWHVPPDDEGDGRLGAWLEELMGDLAPLAVVIGETPIRGSLRMAHRVASALGLWQIALDNYYGPMFPASLVRDWPRIDRWLLLGLTRSGDPDLRDGKLQVVPPLIAFPPGFPDIERDRVTVIGYDKQTVLSGARLLARLPEDTAADFFLAPQWEEFLRRQPEAGLDRPDRRVLVLPPDGELYASLARSRFILGKAGFQQVVEGVLLGAPIVCQVCGGGLAGVLLSDYLQPYVRFLDSEERFDPVLLDLGLWLAAPRIRRWSRMAAEVDDPIAHGAEKLAALAREAA